MLLTTGQLWQHQLLFHKIGRDGSAKCDAFFTGQENDVLYGALYRIDPDQKKYLDDAEGIGRGYEMKQVMINVGPESFVNAFTYYATRISKEIKPFHWYKQHVLAGAQEHCFPQHYIDQIADITSSKDKNTQRTNKELGIYDIETSCDNNL